MLKILHIIPNLRKGGAERLVVDIVRALNNNSQISVRLVILHNTIDYEVSDIKNFIYYIPSYVKLSLLRKNQLHIEELQRFIDDFAPDVIHSHLYEAEIVSRSCFYPKAKWFSHGHGFFREFEKIRVLDIFSVNKITTKYEQFFLLNRYKINNGNTYIAVSQAITEFIKKVFKGNCVVLNNSIDYELFANKSVNKTKSNILQLMTVGRLDANKNHILQIEILNEVLKKGVEAKLHILGNGPLLKDLKEKVKELNLDNHVKFLGFIDDIYNYYQLYDIYIHTAKKEAFGLTLLEAMASGLPVVTLDGKGNRDIIEQEKNGYLIFENDASKFADIIVNLWQDTAKYKDMSFYARTFSAKYNMENYIEKLLELYNYEIHKNV